MRARTVLLVVLLGGTMTTAADSAATEPDWTGQRHAMVAAVQEDVARNADVLGRPTLSPKVEAALLTVRRHLFVPREIRRYAYANRALPIGLDQTISQPTIVALMTDLLELAPDDIVLEVGTGSGYQAAVLSHIVPQGHVHTIEIVEDLAKRAGGTLQALDYLNVTVHTGDGYRGVPDHAPFAAIMVTAAAAEVPQPLLGQLRPGGRLVMPVGRQGEVQWLTVVDKLPDGMTMRRRVLPVRFVPLTGEGQDRN